jgi:type IV secretory pathway component VirB8
VSDTPQPNFKRDRLPDLLMIGLFVMGMTAAVVVLIGIAFFKKPPPIYLALTPDDQITQDVPLEKPNLPENVMLNWVNDVITNTFTFNFKNVQRVLDTVRPAYTSTGYVALTKILQDKNILSDLDKEKWVYNCFATSAPQIQNEQVINDRYVWTVLIPIRIQLDNVRQQGIGKEWRVTLKVVRVPTLVGPMGFQIDDISVEEQGSGVTQGPPPLS